MWYAVGVAVAIVWIVAVGIMANAWFVRASRVFARVMDDLTVPLWRETAKFFGKALLWTVVELVPAAAMVLLLDDRVSVGPMAVLVGGVLLCMFLAASILGTLTVVSIHVWRWRQTRGAE